MKGIFFLAVGLMAVFTLSLVLPADVHAVDETPSVELGKKLFNDPSLGTNGKSCSTCHQSEEKAGSLAARGVWFGGEAKTLEQAVNFCIKATLEGKPLPEDSVEARSIALYMRSLIKQ